MTEIMCNLCKLEFKTRSGLWKHNNNKHKEIINEKHLCKYCNKELCDRHSRWKHENKVCKKNTNILKENNTIHIQNNIQTQNNIHTQNNITNNIINITFNKLGHEDINILTQEEIEEIINSGLNSIIKLIELINFNKEHPQNHTFCTTSLNNKYVTTLNTETNEIEKQRKIDIFDNVLFYALNHIDMLKDKITNKKKKKEFSYKILELDKKIINDMGYKKIYHEQLNALSYNKRNIVRNTWDSHLKKYFDLIIN
jgi:hypothetical protein